MYNHNDLAQRIESLQSPRAGFPRYTRYDVTNVVIGDLLTSRTNEADQVIMDFLEGKHGVDVQDMAWTTVQQGLWGTGKHALHIKHTECTAFAVECMVQKRHELLRRIASLAEPRQTRPVAPAATGATTPAGLLLDRMSGWTLSQIPTYHEDASKRFESGFTFPRQIALSIQASGRRPQFMAALAILLELDPNHADLLADKDQVLADAARELAKAAPGEPALVASEPARRRPRA